MKKVSLLIACFTLALAACQSMGVPGSGPMGAVAEKSGGSPEGIDLSSKTDSSDPTAPASASPLPTDLSGDSTAVQRNVPMFNTARMPDGPRVASAQPTSGGFSAGVDNEGLGGGCRNPRIAWRLLAGEGYSHLVDPNGDPVPLLKSGEKLTLKFRVETADKVSLASNELDWAEAICGDILLLNDQDYVLDPGDMGRTYFRCGEGESCNVAFENIPTRDGLLKVYWVPRNKRLLAAPKELDWTGFADLFAYEKFIKDPDTHYLGSFQTVEFTPPAVNLPAASSAPRAFSR